jgi:hypothetical protein
LGRSTLKVAIMLKPTAGSFTPAEVAGLHRAFLEICRRSCVQPDSLEGNDIASHLISAYMIGHRDRALLENVLTMRCPE